MSIVNSATAPKIEAMHTRKIGTFIVTPALSKTCAASFLVMESSSLNSQVKFQKMVGLVYNE